MDLIVWKEDLVKYGGVGTADPRDRLARHASDLHTAAQASDGPANTGDLRCVGARAKRGDFANQLIRRTVVGAIQSVGLGFNSAGQKREGVNEQFSVPQTPRNRWQHLSHRHQAPRFARSILTSETCCGVRAGSSEVKSKVPVCWNCPGDLASAHTAPRARRRRAHSRPTPKALIMAMPAGLVGDGTTGIGGRVGVSVAVLVRVGVSVNVAVTVAVLVAVAVAVAVDVAVTEGVMVGVWVGVVAGAAFF